MKRLIVALIMLMITLSVGYAYYNHSLSAANEKYNLGTALTGRVNKVPSSLVGSKQTVGMKKGDRYYLGTNTVGDNSPVGWQLIIDNSGIASGVVSEDSWLAMTTEPIAQTRSYNSIPLYYRYSSATLKEVSSTSTGVAPYNDSNVAAVLNDFNQQWSNENVADIVGTHLNTWTQTKVNGIKAVYSSPNAYAYTLLKEFLDTETFGKNAFLLHFYYLATQNISGFGQLNSALTRNANDLKFYFQGASDTNFTYFMHDIYYDASITNPPSSVVIVNGVNGGTSMPVNSVTALHYVRPSMFIQKNPVVFAVSTDSGSSTVATITAPSLPSGYTNITKDALGAKMKIRKYASNMTVSFGTLKNATGKELAKNNNVYQTTKDTAIQLEANGNTVVADATISALVFNNQGDFIAYAPLGKATGNQENYTLDLSGLAVGTYQIAIVNEEFNNNDTNPARSTLLSEVKSIQIVEPLSAPVFTAQQNLVYNKNVNAADTVGTITSQNGAGSAVYTIVADSAYPNDAEHLSVAADGKTVVVKGSSLDAGTYHFKIRAQDANGDPKTALEASASFQVGKADVSVAFDNTAITKKGIEESKNSWNETATSTPNTGTKITYSVNGGDIGLITIDADTGAITYKGNGAFGKVEIKATADDDPASGKDNYNSADTTKEIVIYREVDGSVEPHSNSSDKSTPTFTAADSNIKAGGTIGTIKGSKGTPNEIGGSTTTYAFGLKTGGNSNFFAVDANNGTITSTANLSVGTYNITVTVADNWSTKEIPVTINVGMAKGEDLKFYENSTSTTAISTKSVKITDSNVTVYATVKGSSNTNPVTYKIKDGSTNVIEVNSSSGAITIHGVGTVTIVAEKQGAAGQTNASAELTFTVSAGTQNFIYTDDAGNELPKSGTNYSVKTEIYEPNKTIQLYTSGNPNGSGVSYQLKSGSPTDVVSVTNSGLVTILNASQTAQMGKVIIQATSHDPSGNYEDKTIELPVNIDRGTRTIAFKENPIYVASGNGTVTPVIEVDGVIDTDGDVLIEIDSNEDSSIVWTSDNKSINYDYSEASSKDIKIHATKPMNRNYKIAETEGTLHIMGPDENVLAITSPGKITYGDHFTIRSSQYDADSTNVKYTFEIDDTTYITTPTVNGNSAQFDALKFSGTNKTTITVTRTADGETPLSKKVQIAVLAKSIKITIDNQEKLKGEQNPTLTYRNFKSQLISWNGIQDIIQENDIKLSTTANTNSAAGSYPIKGDANLLNRTYPNYSFTYQEASLTVKEDNIEDNWYHLELDDGSSTAYTGSWTNKDILLIADHNEYINMSLDQSTWNPTQVTISKEGETKQSFWMKKDSGAITKEKQEIIRIDKTPPKIKGIKAKDTNNKLQDIINKISGGIFFKPGTAFEITTSDAKDDLKVSGTKEIAYKVYKVEQQSRAGDELIKDGSLSVTNEKASITISELMGTYRVCVIPTDNAGNTNSESCHEVELKKIGVDVDGDGKPDFNDPDGDGCPDLNIKWKDPDDASKWVVINGDRNSDGIPDLNIDSDGDGKPDLNIDTDNDGKPDLNLVILKKADWKPAICVKADSDNGILEEYCTGTSAKAVINVDTDDDGVPNINIDNKGDFKPHINISNDGETPIINIATIHDWKPELNKLLNGFSFDTMAINEKKDVLLNIDTDNDGRPDVNIDLDNDGTPDINIDTDFDWIPNIDIDSTGDGNADTNIDIDNDGIADENIVEIKEWKPNKDVDGSILYDTMDFNDPDPSDEGDDDSDNKPNKNPSDKPNDDSTNAPTPPKNDTSVKGQYNPVTSMGGAMTGNNTSIMPYSFLCFIAFILLMKQMKKIKK